MLDASGRGALTSDEDERESRYAQRTVLRLKIESAVMTEIHLHESQRSLAYSTLRSELRAVCAEARRLDMRAEQLVVVIKEVWNSIPAARSHARPADAQSLLSRVVSYAVDEYFPKPPLRS
jgi:hypothetical protein